MKALKIKFELTNSTEKPYDPEFVSKIQKSREDYKNGHFISIEKEDLKNFLGVKWTID